jgi:DNA modification methylase
MNEPKLIVGDCLGVLREMADQSVDMVFEVRFNRQRQKAKC